MNKFLYPKDLPQAFTLCWSKTFATYKLEQCAMIVLAFCQEKKNWGPFTIDQLCFFANIKGYDFKPEYLAEFVECGWATPLEESSWMLEILKYIIGEGGIHYRITEPQVFALKIWSEYSKRIAKIRKEMDES